MQNTNIESSLNCKSNINIENKFMVIKVNP